MHSGMTKEKFNALVNCVEKLSTSIAAIEKPIERRIEKKEIFHKMSEIEMLDMIENAIKNINRPFTVGEMSTKLLDKKRNYAFVKKCLDYLARKGMIRKFKIQYKCIFGNLRTGIFYLRKGIKIKKMQMEEIK